MKLISRVLCAYLICAAFWVPIVHADGWFDEYGNLPWPEEKLRLDSFGRFLEQSGNYREVLAFYQGKGESKKSLDRRVLRAKKHLQNRFGFKSDRLTIVVKPNAGRRWTILQPVKHGLDHPTFPLR